MMYMSGLIRISPLQSKLLLDAAAGGKSPNEMEELYGIPAAQALAHVRQVLAQKNVWTELEKEQLLMVDLENLKNHVTQRVYKSDDIDSEKVLIQLFREIGRIIESRKGFNDKQITKFAQEQAKATMGFLEMAFSAAVQALEDLYPEVDHKELSRVFENELKSAIV